MRFSASCLWRGILSYEILLSFHSVDPLCAESIIADQGSPAGIFRQWQSIEFREYEECEVKCRKDNEERSMLRIAILRGLTKEHG